MARNRYSGYDRLFILKLVSETMVKIGATMPIRNVCQVSSSGFMYECRSVGIMPTKSMITGTTIPIVGELKISHSNNPSTAPTWQMISKVENLAIPNLTPNTTTAAVHIELPNNRIAARGSCAASAALPEMAVKIVQVNHDTMLGLVFRLTMSTKYGKVDRAANNPANSARSSFINQS